MTIKSQNDLNQPETHSTEVLLSTIEELEKVKKERDTYYNTLMHISYLTPALGGNKKDMERALLDIDYLCNWALRPDEMKAMENEFKEIEELEK